MASAANALRPHESASTLPGDADGASGKILYVTPEISDFVKAGGLGDVSAALPRALRAASCDVRILVPGYRQVVKRCEQMEIVGQLDGVAGIPPCEIGQSACPTA